MKQVTFIVHDCGCVDLCKPEELDGDRFQIMAITWYAMIQLNDMAKCEHFEASEIILENTLHSIKRTESCVTRHQNKNAN